MLFNLRTREGGTELASLPAALSSCPSRGKWGVDSLLRKRIGRKEMVFVWQGWKRVWICVALSSVLSLFSVVLLKGWFLQEKCGSDLMVSVAIQCPRWILGGIACLNIDLYCPAACRALDCQVRNHFHRLLSISQRKRDKERYVTLQICCTVLQKQPALLWHDEAPG